MAENQLKGVVEKNRVEPEEALGASFRIKELPDGLKFYINQQEFDLGRNRVVVNLYRLVVAEGGRKLRRSHLEKFINEFPEEEHIALTYGPWPDGYVWIAKWTPPGEEERSMISPEIYIDESWRGRFEEAKRKAMAGKADPAASAVPPAPALPAAGVPSMMEILAVMREAEDRAYNNLQRVLAATKTESPTGVMEKGLEAVGRMMEKAVEMNFGILRKVNKGTEVALNRALREEEEDDQGEGEGEQDGAAGGSGLPAWLEPFIPKVKEYLSTLLDGGPVGAFVKNQIVSSETFKEIFADKDKWETAVKAMREHFGDDKTEKAVGILLGKKPGKK